MTPHECCICLGVIDTQLHFNLQNRLSITRCGHRFHFMCLYRWCSQNNTCPTCRTPNIFSFITNNNLNHNNNWE